MDTVISIKDLNVLMQKRAVFTSLVMLFFMRVFFSFSKLHANAGARLCSKILLLPPTLCNSHGDESVNDHLTNGANANTPCGRQLSMFRGTEL